MTHNFENTANIGDTIKAFDFQPMPSRDDVYVEGTVIAKGKIYASDGTLAMIGFTIEATGSDEWSDRKIGEKVFVPFQMFMDFDNRVTKIN